MPRSPASRLLIRSLLCFMRPTMRVQLAELGQGHRPGELAHAEVHPEEDLPGELRRGEAVLAPAGGHVVVGLGPGVGQVLAGGHDPALPGGDGLVVLQAEGPRVPEGAQLAALEAAAVGLGHVLHDLQVVPPGHLHDLVHLRGHAAHVHREDRLGALGDLALQVQPGPWSGNGRPRPQWEWPLRRPPRRRRRRKCRPARSPHPRAPPPRRSGSRSGPRCRSSPPGSASRPGSRHTAPPAP